MHRANLTLDRIQSLTCKPGRSQSLYWDARCPGLGLRVTPTGTRTFIFEGRLHGKTCRQTIGLAHAWSLEQARARANELRRLVDAGTDPRQLERDQKLEAETRRQTERDAQRMCSVTALAAWQAYVRDRAPYWGTRHAADHALLATPGGQPAKRSGKTPRLTMAGPLYGLLQRPLVALSPEAIEAWAKEQAPLRPTRARLAWRCLKAFLNWCAESPDYARLVAARNPAKSRRIREALGRPGVKRDALQREQLRAWFEATQRLSNRTAAAALQVVLLTGARPGEVLSMRWEGVDYKWRSLTIRDKDEGERVIPLTPYVASILQALPRQGEWVFQAPSISKLRAAGEKVALRPIHEINHPLQRACRLAGIEDLTPHGLRRSYRSLTEWLEAPAGVVAQLMGHKPSAIAEKHYTVRPLDLLRLYAERIEAWILEQAGIVQPALEEPASESPAPPSLRLVYSVGGRR